MEILVCYHSRCMRRWAMYFIRFSRLPASRSISAMQAGCAEARGVDYALISLLGLCVAVLVEYKAMLMGLWEYAPAMPTLFGLGISPLLQMAVLLPLSAYISRGILKRQ